MLDCVIKGGRIVNGSGTDSYVGDVGIKDGKIAEIGRVTDEAARVVSADDLVVAPGFVDMHTHLDAQIMWDPTLIPSSLHGVTTIIGGNCGFGIAPLAEASADYVVHMLSAVEQMPVESLEIGLNPTWHTYGDWISRIEGKTALNCGFLAAHSTIRRFVMGDDWQRAATQDEVDAMAGLVRQTLEAGALGFSSSWNDIHADHHGAPVPSRFAEPDELVQLCTVLRDYPSGIIGFQAGSRPQFSERSIDTMAAMSIAGGTRLNWNALTVGLGVEEPFIRHRLTASDYATDRGGEVYALLNPSVLSSRLTPLTSLDFNTMPEWAEVMALDVDAKCRAFADPAVRAKLQAAIDSRDDLRPAQNIDKQSVLMTVSPELKHLEGRALVDIARERNCTTLDAWCDIAVADRMRCYFFAATVDPDDKWRLMKELLNDSRVVIGGSDAGAHVDQLDMFRMYTELVGPTVRDRGLLPLERAVQLITDGPARWNNLKDRGRLETGWAADIVIFDPATVGPTNTELRNDMPGDQPRLFAAAKGIERVFVNGTETVVQGEPTGAVPGAVLRSGVDQVRRAVA
jgi:N-acyl-D-aspartate/D-glutamate deacylase